MHIATVLPTRIKAVIGLAVAIVALLAAGVPLATFAPFAGLAACLGMHLFMGHGHHDGLSASGGQRPEPDQGTHRIESSSLDR